MTNAKAYAEAVHKSVDECDLLDSVARRVSTVLLQANGLVQLGEVQKLSVCDVLERATVIFADLESILNLLMQVDKCCSNHSHAVLQNARLDHNDKEVVFRVCPGMARAIKSAAVQRAVA